MLQIPVSVSALLSGSSSSCWESGMTGVLCWHLWTVFHRVLQSDGEKEHIWLLFLGGNIIRICMSCRWYREVFALSAVEESGILFYGKVFSGKNCSSASASPVCSISMWRAREGMRVMILVLVCIRAKVKSVLFFDEVLKEPNIIT